MLADLDSQAGAGEGRGECSLCVLTNQFLKYMASSGQNTVDLKQAAVDLQTRKRRIYDVTNVLEGVGLIQKTGTNNVQWVSPDEGSSLSTRRFREVHEKRVRELRAIKQQMEGSIAQLTECIHQLTSRPEAQQMLYVTQRDLVSLEGLQGQQLMAIKAPAGSSLTIPDPHRGADRERRAVPHFKAAVSSKSGPLALWLVAGPEEAARHEAAAPALQRTDSVRVARSGGGCRDDVDADPYVPARTPPPATAPAPRMSTRRRSRKCYADGDDSDYVGDSPVRQSREMLGPATPMIADGALFAQ